jgi:hypothetical protein
MEMTGFRALHQSMNNIGVDIQQFRFRTGAVEFDCLFSVREDPFVLSLTTRGADPVFFRFDVTMGYQIRVDFDPEQYKLLAKVLRTDGRAGNKLIPSVFLGNLNNHIPAQATTHAVPAVETILQLRHDVEERDRPYFDAWILWGNDRSPSRENKKKTLLILGPEALAHSERINASSRWNAKPTNRGWH